jgi:hypothetical protein
MDKYQIWH